MEFVEFTAKTVDDAITAACQKFLVTSDRLEYEVMEEGSSGFLGFNAKPARIKAKVKETVEDKARTFLDDVFAAMHMTVLVEGILSPENRISRRSLLYILRNTTDIRRVRKWRLQI